VVREGLKRMLEREAPATVFAEAATRAEALAQIGEGHWDLVVLDISLGRDSGLELLQELKRMRPRVPVLVLSMHSEEQYARRAFRAGASGYIMKNSGQAEVVGAVHKVLRGGKYVSPQLAEILVADFDDADGRPAHERLSQREFEVLRLLGSGTTVSEIAGMLSLSDKTVSTYRTRVLEKLSLKSNAELVRYALDHSLIE
jgi:two-component system, NarL family, invasion response regulator UvrY